MAYNEKLADMTRELISQTHKKVEEKAMFGGLCFIDLRNKNEQLQNMLNA